MNVVTLIGNLATDVELRELGEERKVAGFLLAVDRLSQERGADFVRISVWNKHAEICDRFLSKGSRVAVEGRLRSRTWDEPDGKRRSAVDVVAHRVQFLDRPGESAAAETPFEAAAMS